MLGFIKWLMRDVSKIRPVQAAQFNHMSNPYPVLIPANRSFMDEHRELMGVPRKMRAIDVTGSRCGPNTLLGYDTSAKCTGPMNVAFNRPAVYG